MNKLNRPPTSVTLVRSIRPWTLCTVWHQQAKLDSKRTLRRKRLMNSRTLLTCSNNCSRHLKKATKWVKRAKILSQLAAKICEEFRAMTGCEPFDCTHKQLKPQSIKLFFEESLLIAILERLQLQWTILSIIKPRLWWWDNNPIVFCSKCPQ